MFLTFPGMALHADLIPLLLKIIISGNTWIATGKHILFTLFFGRGTSDGCVRFVNSDSNDVRTLTMQITGGLNTVEYCLNTCKGYGYTSTGMEFGAECCMCRLLMNFPLLTKPCYLRVWHRRCPKLSRYNGLWLDST